MYFLLVISNKSRYLEILTFFCEILPSEENEGKRINQLKKQSLLQSERNNRNLFVHCPQMAQLYM